MVEMSIDLCGSTGEKALDLLFQKVRHPELPMHIGNVVLVHITGVEHFGDGQPVITARARELTTGDASTLTFQFVPSQEHFSVTAVDTDGHVLCPPDSSSAT